MGATGMSGLTESCPELPKMPGIAKLIALPVLSSTIP